MTHLIIRRLDNGQWTGAFERVDSTDPRIVADIIAWHVDQARKRGLTVELVPIDIPENTNHERGAQ